MREELKDLLNKRVRCEGDLISASTETVAKSRKYPKGICGRVTIRNIYVCGEELSHINVRVPIRELDKYKQKVGKHVEFTGLVYKYVKNSRDAKGRLTGIYKEDYGIKDIKKVLVKRDIVRVND